jgi:predicted DNA-binding transcriptional regulator YafY
MSYKFDSLIMILNKLDSKEEVTVHSLMNDIEMSQRTIYRYIQTLQIAGFPIIYDREKESYVFSEGYSLRKPKLSVEETLTLALSKKLLKNFGPDIEKSLGSIEEKLSVKNADIPKHIVLTAEEMPAFVGANLGIIHHARTNYQRIEIVYRALYSDEETVRKVDPYYLFFQDGFWHLRGYCHLREELRTFALDRIISVKILNEYFIPQNISPEDELSGAFGTMVDGEPVEVVLRFDADIKPYVLRKKWHKSQKERELKDGSLEMTFTVNGTDGIKPWIYQWLPHVEVGEPEELKRLVDKDLKEAAKRNG